jgi:hypothetical protein
MMKNPFGKIESKILRLAKETIHTLQNVELEMVGGGQGGACVRARVQAAAPASGLSTSA